MREGGQRQYRAPFLLTHQNQLLLHTQHGML